MRNRRWLRLKLWDALLLLAAIFAGNATLAQTRPVPKQASTKPADPDLVAWWRADHATPEQAPDLSGNGRNVKPVSGRITIESVNKRQGFRFTPKSAALTAGVADVFNFTSDFSVALRVKLSSDLGDVTLLSRRKADGSNGWAIVHGIQGIGGIGFLAAPRVIVPTPCKALDDWVHVAVTFHGKEFLLYIDGKAIGVMELPVIPLASKEPLILGAASAKAHPFDGWLDDIRIYRRGLTATEVESLAYGKEPASPYTPLTPAEEAQVRKLVKALGSDSYPAREKAAKELTGMGRKIMPLLKTYRDSEDLEISLRVKTILGELPRVEGDK